MSSLGQRLTVEQRIARRNAGNIAAGTEPGWADDALEWYLAGDSVSEICEAYHVSTSNFYRAISKAALYRLMKAQGIERMEDIPE